jgi:hypothetical protein
MGANSSRTETKAAAWHSKPKASRACGNQRSNAATTQLFANVRAVGKTVIKMT